MYELEGYELEEDVCEATHLDRFKELL